MKKLNQINRRAFLKSVGKAGLVLTPMQMLINGLVDGLLTKAYSQASAAPVRNYIYLHLGGGMTRFYWDQPLAPYSQPNIIQPNQLLGHVFTRFTDRGGYYDSPYYATTPVTRAGVTLNMPHIWSANIPTANGGMVSMANLLDNMLMMRSFDGKNDFHAEASVMQIRPATGAPSLNGLVADRSTRPIPAVGFRGGHSNAFRSASGAGIATCGNSDPLNELLSPFSRTSSYNPFGTDQVVNDGLSNTFLSRRDALDGVMKAALAQLGDLAKSRYPGSEAIYSIRNLAEPIIKQGVGDLYPVFQNLKAKYQSLISRSAAAIPGVTDKTVSTANIAPVSNNEPNLNGYRVQLRIPDIMEVRNSNLASMLQNTTTITELAESFAVAEFLIANGYSSSATMGLSEVINLSVQNSIDYYTGATVTKNGYWNGDAHGGGAWTGLIINSFIYVALSACLYEFIGVLKSKSLFDETVIQISSDFGRNPGSDGSTGHEPRNSSTTLISGCIKKPIVVGDCLNNGNGWGSWGLAAPMQVDGVSTTLGIGHISSTVSELLRVERLNPNNSTLVVEGSTGVVNNVELAKNV